MKFTEHHIRQLAAQGKIRGYKPTGSHQKRTKNQGNRTKMGEKRTDQPGKRSKALEWLEWNLMYWSNENSLTMEKEYRFDQERKWRFDFCWPSIKLALEFEGGVFMAKSGHNTARHYTKDTEKYNHAALLGWRVIRVTALNYRDSLKLLNAAIGKQ